MANEMKAADLIGKVIIVGENVATITIKGINSHGNLEGEFVKGDAAPIMMPVTLANLQAMMKRGVWRIQESEECRVKSEESAAAQTADDDVQEVEDVNPQKPEPKAEPKAANKREQNGARTSSAEREQARPQGKAKEEPIKPKAKDEKPKSKPKSEKPKAKPEVVSDGKLVYETYTSSRGKQCARILGFAENDAAYKNAAELHGSASWNTTDKGRTLYVAFGPHYVEKAKAVCDALNAGKSFGDCKAIIEGKAAAGEKTYTLSEVAAKLKKLLPDGDKATVEDIKKLLEAA